MAGVCVSYMLYFDTENPCLLSQNKLMKFIKKTKESESNIEILALCLISAEREHEMDKVWPKMAHYPALILLQNNHIKKWDLGIPGWLKDLAPAFGPGRDLGSPGWYQVPHLAPCVEPASPSACVSASLCISLSLS